MFALGTTRSQCIIGLCSYKGLTLIALCAVAALSVTVAPQAAAEILIYTSASARRRRRGRTVRQSHLLTASAVITPRSSQGAGIGSSRF
jgi:hypothetical protein